MLPTFDGANVTRPAIDAWIFGMERHFKIHASTKTEMIEFSYLIWWEDIYYNGNIWYR